MKTASRWVGWPLATLMAVAFPLACGKSKPVQLPPGSGGNSGDGGPLPSDGITGDEGSATGGIGAGGTGAGGSSTAGTGVGGIATGGSATGGDKIPRTGTGGTGTGGLGAGGASVIGSCPNTGGPTMVKLPAGFCIDSTEVTRSQYSAWLNGNPPTTGQTAECAANATFTPDAKCMGTSTDPQHVCLEDCGNHPQVCIDWCDAYAYCKAVGKRLCGRIGGGPNNPGDTADPNLSQWCYACTSNGANDYPYGTSYNPKACNSSDFWPISPPPWDNVQTVPVGSMATCQSSISGFTGVFDLSGNVEEFEDSCTAAGEKASRCNIRGGGILGATSHLSCDSGSTVLRYTVDATIGFRCCSSP